MTTVRTMDAELVVAAGASLGEGPVWDERSGRLGWVDIVGRRLNLTDPATGETESIPTPADIGSAVPRRAGGWVAALADGFWRWTESEGWERLVHVHLERPEMRFNDGKADPMGRFWAGSMAYAKTPGDAALYRLDPDGQVIQVLDGITISNGIAFVGADGRPASARQPATEMTCYYIDTPTHRVDAFDVAPDGHLGNRRTLIDIPADAGSPDGMTMDVDGGLWVALWGGRAVHRYVDGRLDTIVRVPTSHVTSCTFGADGFDELFITSAREELTQAQLDREPLAGALFRVRPGTSGVPPDLFAG